MAEESQESYQRSAGTKQIVGAVALSVALNKVADVVNNLTASVTNAFSFVDKSQKASLALGQNLNTTRERLGDSMDGLRGSIEQKLTAGLVTLDAGMRGNNEGVMKLINQQMLTGTAYQGTSKAFAGLQRVLGLSNDYTNTLAKKIEETGNAYGVATDVLVQAINKMSADFGKFTLLGLQDIPELTAQLTAEFGKANADNVQKAVSFIMDTSQQGLSRLAQLQQAGVQESLMAANSTSERFQILRNAITQGGETFFQLAGDNARAQAAFSAKLGGSADALLLLSEAAKRGTEELNTGAVDPSQTIETRFAEALDPLKQGLMEFAIDAFPYLLAGLSVLQNAFQAAADIIAEGYDSIGGLSGIYDTVKTFVTNFMSEIKTTLKVFGAMLAVLVLPPLISVAVGLITAFAPVILAGLAIASVLYGLDLMIRDVTGNMDLLTIVVDSVKAVFYGLQGGLGQLLVLIGEYVPFAGALKDMGESFVANAEKARADMIAKGGFGVAAEEDEGPGMLEKLATLFDDALATERASFGVEKENAEANAETARNTRPSTNDFQRRTFESISSSIDRILGVDPESANQRIVELLEEGNLIAVEGQNQGFTVSNEQVVTS